MKACTQITHQKLLYCCPHDIEEPSISRHRGQTDNVEISPSMEELKASDNFALFDNQNCGQLMTERLANAQTTRINENPWMALIKYRENDIDRFICGGSLISSRYVSFLKPLTFKI